MNGMRKNLSHCTATRLVIVLIVGPTVGKVGTMLEQLFGFSQRPSVTED